MENKTTHSMYPEPFYKTIQFRIGVSVLLLVSLSAVVLFFYNKHLLTSSANPEKTLVLLKQQSVMPAKSPEEKIKKINELTADSKVPTSTKAEALADLQALESIQ